MGDYMSKNVKMLLKIVFFIMAYAQTLYLIILFISFNCLKHILYTYVDRCLKEKQ